MSLYSIKDLEHLSGIKAHTLRIWEQRYGLLKPKRTETNIREYSDNELRLILNVSLLNKSGYKISQIADMTQSDIERAVSELLNENSNRDTLIDALILSMNELNESRFDKTFSNAILHLGFEKAMLQVIFPFFRRIGIMWQVGTITPAQEHFISNLIRQKMIVAIDGIVTQVGGIQTKAILYLPENELHEIPLLFLYHALKHRGYTVIYLGQSVPLNDLLSLCEYYRPELLFSVFSAEPNYDHLDEYVNILRSKLPNIQCCLSGYQITKSNIDSKDNITVFKELIEIIRFLDHRTSQN
ncbi:MAG: MerR family transcriptional regulator [Bacteroidota bacterium]|jgi:DNA-binding transcriptional MerR regulator